MPGPKSKASKQAQAEAAGELVLGDLDLGGDLDGLDLSDVEGEITLGDLDEAAAMLPGDDGASAAAIQILSREVKEGHVTLASALTSIQETLLTHGTMIEKIAVALKNIHAQLDHPTPAEAPEPTRGKPGPKPKAKESAIPDKQAAEILSVARRQKAGTPASVLAKAIADKLKLTADDVLALLSANDLVNKDGKLVP